MTGGGVPFKIATSLFKSFLLEHLIGKKKIYINYIITVTSYKFIF